MVEPSSRGPAAILSLSCSTSSLALHSPLFKAFLSNLYSRIQINNIKSLFPSMKIGIKCYSFLPPPIKHKRAIKQTNKKGSITIIQCTAHRINNQIKRKRVHVSCKQRILRIFIFTALLLFLVAVSSEPRKHPGINRHSLSWTVGNAGMLWC